MLENVVEFFKTYQIKFAYHAVTKSKNKVSATATIVKNVTLFNSLFTV